MNINNLAAVPSIIFGLLGLAVFSSTLWLAAFCAFGWRPCFDIDDAANHYYCGADSS